MSGCDGRLENCGAVSHDEYVAGCCSQCDRRNSTARALDDLQGKSAAEWAAGINVKPMMIDGKANPEWCPARSVYKPEPKRDAYWWFVWTVHALAVALIAVLVLAGIMCWSAMLGCSAKADIQDNARDVKQVAGEVKTDATLIRHEAAAATVELAGLQIGDKPTGGASVVAGAVTRLGTIDSAAGRIEAAAQRVETAAEKIQEASEHVHDDRPLWLTVLYLSGIGLVVVVVAALLFYSGTLPLVLHTGAFVFGGIVRRLAKFRAVVSAWHPWDAAERMKARRGK